MKHPVDTQHSPTHVPFRSVGVPRGRCVASERGGAHAGSLALLAGLILLAGGALVWTMRARPAATPAPAGGGAATSASDQTPAGEGPAQFTQADTAEVDRVLNASQALRRDEQWGKAEALLREAIRVHVDVQPLYVQLAEVLATLGRHSEAYEAYEKALAIGPRETDLEFAAGTVASAAGNWQRASEHYQAVRRDRPSDPQAALFLAQVQVRLNQFTEAKENLLTVVHLKPDVAIAWGTLADLALRDNAAELSLQHIAKARELEPGVVLWRLIEARAHKRLAQPQRALDLLANLSDEELLQPGVLPLVAESHGMLRQPAAAAAVYRRLSDRFPQRGDLALETALWLERAGDAETALSYAQRARMLGTRTAAEVEERLR